jgi:hypothetical protein
VPLCRARHEQALAAVSALAAAGIALERIGDYVGHSSTYMTDRYRHDEYLARADSRSRIAQLDEGEEES